MDGVAWVTELVRGAVFTRGWKPRAGGTAEESTGIFRACEYSAAAVVSERCAVGVDAAAAGAGDWRGAYGFERGGAVGAAASESSGDVCVRDGLAGTAAGDAAEERELEAFGSAEGAEDGCEGESVAEFTPAFA